MKGCIKKFVSLFICGALLGSTICVCESDASMSAEKTEQYIILEQKDNEKVNVSTALLTKSQAQKCEADNSAVIVESDVMMRGSGASSESVRVSQSQGDTAWNLQMVGADDVEIPGSSDKIKVAVIDSGIDYSSDLNVAARKNFVPGEDDISILYEDGSGHGTSVAGVIAAKDNDDGITGINENVELYSAKVLDYNDVAPVSRVIEGIDWAIEQGVNIINISMGTKQYSASLEYEINRAIEKGILVIAAAGNDGTVEYPAAFDKVISVGAVGADGYVSEFSAQGEALDVVAPGEQISSTGMFDGIMVSGGTSMAAPHVTGIASVLWQINKDVPADFIRQLIYASAVKSGDEEKYGHGIVDLAYAMENYDEAWDEYQKGIETGTTELEIEKNYSEIPSFDDVNTVEGRWKGDKHEELAGENSIFTGDDLKVIVIGARLPDQSKYGIDGMTYYPPFHGYYGEDRTSNYIACYTMLTKMASVYRGGNYSDPSIITGLSSNDYNMMTKAVGGGIGGVKWTTILADFTTSDKYKSYVVYGMALHAITDTFAHSTYNSKTGKKILHDNDDNGNGIKDADDPDMPDTTQNRYKCAEKAAINLLNHIKGASVGSASDFVVSSTYNGTFKLGGASKFASAANSSIYNSNRTFFDNININI